MKNKNEIYIIGIGHKEYSAEKILDNDYYILTLAAIARELGREQITQANVFLAAGLPLSWVAKQRKAFQAYLLQESVAEFTFRRKDYRIRIVGAAVYPQRFAAIAPIVNHFTGSNMLCDIGNGTMNILRTLDSKVDLRQMFTEKYGVQQCVLAIQEAIMREHHAELDEQMIHNFLRHSTAGIAEDARALEYLRDRKMEGSPFSKSVVQAINDCLDAQKVEGREDSFMGRFRLMLREELKAAGNVASFQPVPRFPSGHRKTPSKRWRFWTLSTA